MQIHREFFPVLGLSAARTFPQSHGGGLGLASTVMPLVVISTKSAHGGVLTASSQKKIFLDRWRILTFWTSI
jgi:hypothetical protein